VPKDDRERKWVTFNTFILHFRPVRVPAKTLSYTHTFGLGGMSLVLVLLLVGTGVLLMFAYEPAPGSAYDSVLRLQETVTFGKFVRGVHHWSANLLIVVMVLHLLRVVFTGAFHPPRQFNWVIGLGLLACVLASNFTGYLLPWDQLSYWAITISTGMLGYVPWGGGWLQAAVRGGDEIGRATLITFYTLHTTVVPVFLFVLMGFHFWRVRKAKGVVVPRSPGEAVDPQPEKVLGLPFLFMREFVVALILVASVFLFSALVAAPLGEAANAGMSPNPAKAPWYFMGFQELLLHFHPVFAVVLLPLAGAVGLVMIAYLGYDEDPSGIWFASDRGRVLAKTAAVTALVATPVLVMADEWLLDLVRIAPGLPPILRDGIVPVGVLCLAFWAGYRWLRTRKSATRAEGVQAAFVFLAVSFLVLTVVGVWFRGPGMTLGWAGW
jgi:quinol-cytochrome oxidoreductase complex cytochrome b subunit